MFRSSSGRTSPFQGEGHGFESRTEYKKNEKKFGSKTKIITRLFCRFKKLPYLCKTNK
jgi:hypothetical protein